MNGAIIIEGHVQGLSNARALGRKGIPVYVISRYDCIARYSKYCNKFFRCPDYLSDDFVVFLMNLAKREGIKDWILIPSNDHAVYNISRNKGNLQQYFKIISPDTDIFEKIYNKESLINICQSADISVPLSWFPENMDEIIDAELLYPVLVKGKNGLSFYRKHKRKAYLARNRDDLLSTVKKISAFSSIKDIFIQNVLPCEKQKPISFTSFSIAGKVKAHWSGRKIREHPHNFGTATYCSTSHKPDLLPEAEKIMGLLNYTGVSEIEFLLDERDNIYKLIEINARTWLWVDMAIQSNINYPLMIYNYLNGIPMKYTASCESDIKWIHYLTDLPYSIIGIIRGYYSASEIFNSYKAYILDAVYASDDKLPSFAELFLLPSLILRR